MSRPIAIYTSYNVRYPLGGHVLAELHYIVGLQRLGYQVFVVEESGSDWAPCYDPVRNEMTRNPQYGIGQLVRMLRRFGLEKSWCYVDSERQYHGLTCQQLRDACRHATVLFSRAGVNWVDEFAECPVKVLMDTDPGLTQFRMPDEPVSSCSGYASPYDFDFHFTCGERLGQPDCPVPLKGLTWRIARQAVVLDLVPFHFDPTARYFTTIMSWKTRAPIIYAGKVYGQKNLEFMKVIDLPRRVGPQFEIAVAGSDLPREQLLAAGWRLADPGELTQTVDRYLDFICRSRGEFSVAVNLSIVARTGIVTDRAIAYLAAGKPVILQDTGFSETLPTGEGLLAFQTVEQAAEAIHQVNADYERHCRAARRLAEQYFDSDRVLGDLLRQCNLPVAR